MIHEDVLKGSINTADRQLLYEIRELLKVQNKLLALQTDILKNMTAKPQEVNEVKTLNKKAARGSKLEKDI